MHFVFARRDRCNRFLFSQQDASDSSAPGWFKLRRPFSAKPRRHQPALRAQADSCSHEPTALSPLSLQGNWKRGVPETSPCHGQAKQSGELDPRKVTTDCRERSRGIETSTELVIGTRSASAQFVVGFCTWAASAGSCERKPAVTDAAANPTIPPTAPPMTQAAQHKSAS